MSNDDTFFNPKDVHDYFAGIIQVPHPSANQPNIEGNEDPLRKYVKEEASKIPNVDVVFYNEAAAAPGERVIILRRKGAGSYAGKTPVILQAHMDMVFNPVDMEFPLKMVFVKTDSKNEGQKTDKWIKANDKRGKDSTLGADDGIGVATALAILKDETLKNYPIECLFTLQEETDMGGAQNCDLDNLTGDKLLNLDAETLNSIIFGSAGGSEAQYVGSCAHCNSVKKQFPDGYVVKRAFISGLKGGHSGVDINKGRGNAIKILNQALIRLNKRMTHMESTEAGIGSFGFLIYSMARHDVIKANAIPAEAEAIIVISKKDSSNFDSAFNTLCESLKTQYLPEEPGFKYSVDTIKLNISADKLLDENSTDTLHCVLQQIPHGVLKMIPSVPDVVQMSSNLYDIEVSDRNITISSSNRSSDDPSLQALEMLQKSIGIAYNFLVYTDINSYPPWPPDESSQLLNTAKNVYVSEFGEKNCDVNVIHAGLECGVLVKRFNDEIGRKIDAISIGPTIKDPHTPNERLQVEDKDGKQTVQIFYNLVSQIIKNIFQ